MISHDSVSVQILNTKAILRRLYLFSLTVGILLLRAGKPAWAIRRIANPMSYYRGMEFRILFELADFAPGQRILDIGSPKLIFLYLASQLDINIVGTDLFDDFVCPSQDYFNQAGFSADVGKRIIAEQQDARGLRYPDASFDCVYSISVIEHIPDDGDRAALREMTRVLKPGGKLVLTVPYRAEGGRDIFVQHGIYGRSAEAGPVFYERHYGPEELRTLAFAVPGLRPVHVRYVGEPWLPWGSILGRLPRPILALISPFQPLFEMMFLRRVRGESLGSRGAAIAFVKEDSL